jgi:hypothetical protein
MFAKQYHLDGVVKRQELAWLSLSAEFGLRLLVRVWLTVLIRTGLTAYGDGYAAD